MKIIQRHEECIGCGSCVAICPKYWEMNAEGRAYPIGGEKKEAGDYELEIDKIGCNKEAADACPVQIIFLLQ